MPPRDALRTFFLELIREIYLVSSTLFKLMIPVLIVVKLLEEAGAIPYISYALEPLMVLVGLPESMGLVWATTLLTNIYGGMIIFFSLAPQESLTVAQVTVLGGMMLIAHALPVEVRIAQKTGVRMVVNLLTRMVGALLFGLLLHHIYTFGSWLQTPAPLLWEPPPMDDSLTSWAVAQAESLGMIVLIISALLTLLKILRLLGVERLLIWLLQPVLRLLGIGPSATSITIIGITLGLAFGGGLLIREARAGHVSRRDVFAAITLLSLCHSIIEDTLLVLLLGADISGVLWMRLLFSLVIVATMTRVLDRCSERFQQRFLVHPVASS